MTTHDGDSRDSFKRSTRMPLDAVVRLHFEGTVAYQNGFAANVSASGMFVKHPDPPPAGTRLVFEFVVGSERKPVQGAGVVAWIREKYQGPGRPAGIGIQFTQVDPVSKQHIAEALFEYLEASLGEELAGRAGEDLGVGDDELAAAQESVRQLDLPTPEQLEADATRPSPTAPPPGAAAQSWTEIEVPPEPAEPGLPPAPTTTPPPAPPRPEPPRADPPRFSLAPTAEGNLSAVETEEQRVERMVREALAEQESFAGAAVARSAGGTSPVLWIVLAAIAVAVGGWALWHFGIVPRGTAPRAAAVTPATPTATPRPTLPSDLGPISTLAETVGASNAAETAPETALPTADGATSGEAEEGTSAAPEAPTTEAPQQPIATATAAGAPAVPTRTATPAPAVVTEPGGAPRATRLDEIEWTEATGTTVVTLSGDGPFAPGSFSYSEIGGDKPRVLVRLRGLEEPYRRGALAVGTSAVSGIRTGWHVKEGMNEQHVVLDLAPGGAALDGFEAVGSRIVLKLRPR